MHGFTVLGDGWAKDHYDVFYNAEKVRGASATGFEVLGAGWAKDHSDVFYNAQKVRGASAHGFEVLGGGWAKDHSDVFYNGQKIQGASSTGFEVLGGGWAKDFCDTFRHGHKVTGAPPSGAYIPVTGMGSLSASSSSTGSWYIGHSGGSAWKYFEGSELSVYLKSTTDKVKMVAFGKKSSGNDDSWFVLHERGGYKSSLNSQYSDLADVLRRKKHTSSILQSIALGPDGRYFADFDDSHACKGSDELLTTIRQNSVKEVSFDCNDGWFAVCNAGGHSYKGICNQLHQTMSRSRGLGDVQHVSLGPNGTYFVELGSSYQFVAPDGLQEKLSATTGPYIVGLRL